MSPPGLAQPPASSLSSASTAVSRTAQCGSSRASSVWIASRPSTCDPSAAREQMVDRLGARPNESARRGSRWIKPGRLPLLDPPAACLIPFQRRIQKPFSPFVVLARKGIRGRRRPPPRHMGTARRGARLRSTPQPPGPRRQRRPGRLRSPNALGLEGRRARGA